MAEAIRLLLLRHGEAERSAPRDDLRALTGAGRAEVMATAKRIAELDLPSPVVVASPFLRARETASIIAGVLAAGEVRTVSRITPDDAPVRALAAIEPLCAAGGVLVVVTHMPLIGGLLGLLVDGDPARAPGFVTASGALLGGELAMPGLMRVLRQVGPYA